MSAIGVSRVAVFRGPWSVGVEDIEMPSLRTGEALVQMEACALCTMEKQMFTGDLAVYPAVPGHEVTGTVVAVGPASGAGAGILGTRVAVDLLTRCGSCPSCRLGRSCVCQAPQGSELPTGLIGMGAGLGDFFIGKVADCYPVPSGVDVHLAALVEPLACVIQSIRRSAFRAGERCVVAGAGFMGRLHQIVLRAFTAADVDCLEPNVARARMFTSRGGEHLGDAGGNEGAYDRVFVTFVTPESLNRALALVADGGVVVLFGGQGGLNTWTIDPYILHRRAISLVGAYGQERQDWLDAVELLGSPDVRAELEHLVSGDFLLEDITAALKSALDVASFRIIVRP